MSNALKVSVILYCVRVRIIESNVNNENGLINTSCSVMPSDVIVPLTSVNGDVEVIIIL